MAGPQSNGFDILEAGRRKSIKMGDVPVGGSTILQLFVPSTPLRTMLPPNLPATLWQRDRILSLTPRADAQWGAAIGIAVTKVASLAWEVRSDIGLRSKRAQELCLNADSALGQGGWVHYIAKQVRDYLCTNNGCVTEIVRETMAYGSRIVGINHLPSIRCRRTGLPEKPIIYIDKMGREHLLNWWQVMYFSDLPDPDELLYGGGLCSAERAYPQIAKMASIEAFVYEKVSGSRPLAVHIISGLKTEQIEDAIKASEDQMAREGMSSYMGAVIMATINPTTAPSIVTIPLAELPNGFDAKEERDRADLIYANAIGLDPQDLSPLATSNLGTATQSLVLHDKAKGRGLVMFKQAFIHAINQLILDSRTQFLFHERDYDDLKKKADVSKARADLAKTRIDAQITTADQEREILVDEDELPRSFIQQDTIPGESLSDTDKYRVGGPYPPEGEVTFPSPDSSEEADGSEDGVEPSAEEPYLLTAGKSINDGLFSGRSRTKPSVSVDLSEEDETLKLVAEMMQKLYPGKKGVEAVRTKTVWDKTIVRCKSCNRRLISTKVCHHCGMNFHKGGGGGGGTHTKMGVKLTPKLAKDILADPQGHDPDTIKSAAKHLHDKGYIGHTQYMKELQKAESNPSSSSPTSKPTGGGFATPLAAYGVMTDPGASPSLKIEAAEHILNWSSSNSSKKAALDHLYDEGFLTGSQHQNAILAISQGKPLGQITVNQQGKFVEIGPKAGGPKYPGAAGKILEDPSASSGTKIHAAGLLHKNGQMTQEEYDKVTSDIAKSGPHGGTGFGSGTGTSAFKDSTEANFFLNHPDASDKIKLDAAGHLYKKGEMTESQYKMTKAVYGGTGGPTPPLGAGGFHTGSAKNTGQVFVDDKHAFNTMQASSTSQDYKIAAAKHLMDSPTATMQQKVAANQGLYLKGHITKEQHDANLEAIKTGTPVKTAHPTKFTSFGDAEKALADPHAPYESKVAAADHLYKSGILTKDEYTQEIAKAGGATKPTSPLFSSNSSAHQALNDPLSSQATKIAANSHLYDKGMITKEEFDSNTQKILGGASKVPGTSGGPTFVPVSKPKEAHAVLANPNASPEAKLQAAKLLNDKGYTSKSTYQLQVNQIKQQQQLGGVTPSHAQQSAVNAAQAKINAHQNPTPQNTANAQAAQTQAQQAIKGGIVAHEKIPKDVKQFVGTESGSVAAAEKWGHEHYQQWLDGLPADQKQAMTKYTGGSYTSINNHLRGGGKPTSQDLLRDAALKKGRTPEDLLVHRGFDHTPFREALEAGTVTPGTVFHDKGYVSTSLHSERAFQNKIRMRAVVPKGSPGGYVQSISQVPSELEFLMPRSSSFKILGYQKVPTLSGSYYWLVDAEYIGSGEVFGA